MAGLACAYGLLKTGSIWYPINLLAATLYAESLRLGPAQLNAFHADSFGIALLLHGIGSVFVGLLYGAMLPMYPRKPILTAGFIAPFLWTGVLHSALGIISPILNARINWFWFVLSQIAFGLVAGFVVNLHAKVRTPQFRSLPFAVRAGIHVLGDDEDKVS